MTGSITSGSAREATARKKKVRIATTLTNGSDVQFHIGVSVTSAAAAAAAQMLAQVPEPRNVEACSSDDCYDPELDRAYFEYALGEMRRKSLAVIEHKVMDLGQIAQGESDRSVSAQTMDQTAADLKHHSTQIILIDAALARLADGSFGVSKESGDDISYRRLVANPLARRTLEEQARVEGRQRTAAATGGASGLERKGTRWNNLKLER